LLASRNAKPYARLGYDRLVIEYRFDFANQVKSPVVDSPVVSLIVKIGGVEPDAAETYREIVPSCSLREPFTPTQKLVDFECLVAVKAH
jgi:hypothetical protein